VAQERALVELWPKFGVDFESRPQDLDALFARRAPRDHGNRFGNGDHLALSHKPHPEVRLPRRRSSPSLRGNICCLRSSGTSSPNLRIVCHGRCRGARASRYRYAHSMRSSFSSRIPGPRSAITTPADPGAVRRAPGRATKDRRLVAAGDGLAVLCGADDRSARVLARGCRTWPAPERFMPRAAHSAPKPDSNCAASAWACRMGSCLPGALRRRAQASAVCASETAVQAIG